MKMVAILAMVGLIVFIVCVMLAFIFFIVGVIDEMDFDERMHDIGKRFARWVKGKGGK